MTVHPVTLKNIKLSPVCYRNTPLHSTKHQQDSKDELLVIGIRKEILNYLQSRTDFSVKEKLLILGNESTEIIHLNIIQICQFLALH